jgi:hypothetical protein
VLPNRSIPSATTIPVLIYPDVRAAVSWLTEAFGFVERLQIGEDHRSQMNVGEGGAVILGDAAWRNRMWGEIVALHGRYPKSLAQLKDEWWTEELHTEILCALASWRTELDEKAQDPREEIAFHSQLADYAHRLQKESTGITATWKPGAPPDSWAGT